MKITVENNYKTTNWSGGKTTELFIYPKDGDYATRNFSARVSSATVELESSNFTKLPDVYRMLMVLEGEMDLRIEQNDPIKMKPHDICAFWGDLETKSQGKVRDFNLMVKDDMKGDISFIAIQKQNTMNFQHSLGKQLLVIFVIDGKGTINEQAIKKNDTIIMEDYQGETFGLNNLEEKSLMLAVCHVWEDPKRQGGK